MRQNLGPLIEAAERLQVACLRAGLTVALAESCTGGLIAHAITMVPGSSGYFSGGVVCYSDAVKRDLLDVPRGTIEAHGAVSEAVARAMASGARTRLRTDLGIGVTGVAGPGGGTPAKPVGLVFIALADAAGSSVRRFDWDGDRAANIAASAAAALAWLTEWAETPNACGFTTESAGGDSASLRR